MVKKDESTKTVAEKDSAKAVESPVEAKPTTDKKVDKKDGKKTQKAVSKSVRISFSDPLQVKFVNCIMRCGKKSIAQKILTDAFNEMLRRGQSDALKVFEAAIEHAKPTMEVRSKRVGGAVYQIPVEVPAKRQLSLAIRWILEGARKRKGQPMFKGLAAELLDAFGETGYAFTKKEDSHRMAQANKAFAHLAKY